MLPARVALNATCLGPRPSGARQRFVGIYKELISCMPQTEFVVYNSADFCVSDFFRGLPNIRPRETPLPSQQPLSRFIRGLTFWRKELASEPFDIFEGFHLPVVKPPSGKIIVSIHDIRQMSLDWTGPQTVALRFCVEQVIRSSGLIVTVSEAMKNEILSFFPAARVHVVYNGIDTGDYVLFGREDLDKTRLKFGLQAGFILSVGHLEARKNYRRLIESLALLRERGSTYNLAIVGHDGGEKQRLQRLIHALKLSENVTFLSGVSDFDLIRLYGAARLFIFPSTYEGFGIPILEAMASRCPMILSNIPVFREIAQDSALYFDFDDPEDIASAIERGMYSADDQKARVAVGCCRVQKFTFKSLAEQMKSLYLAV